ncbi:unnamed protein product [Staurois parvus]|uniref:Uncharacterized protein n=1 Tax=Staurois parvus TaxID=386267 RepID=A0ABN9AA58_9NEOB|nr:unnamed protein product [Staurois parvus]
MLLTLEVSGKNAPYIGVQGEEFPLHWRSKEECPLHWRPLGRMPPYIGDQVGRMSLTLEVNRKNAPYIGGQ